MKSPKLRVLMTREEEYRRLPPFSTPRTPKPCTVQASYIAIGRACSGSTMRSHTLPPDEGSRGVTLTSRSFVVNGALVGVRPVGADTAWRPGCTGKGLPIRDCNSQPGRGLVHTDTSGLVPNAGIIACHSARVSACENLSQPFPRAHSC
jgi:hypothetical protein